MEQGPDTRHALAMLDLQIIELDNEILSARRTAEQATNSADRLDKVKTSLMEMRRNVRPMLDPSAPREFPYDKR